jgi:virginiamycin B lyase
MKRKSIAALAVMVGAALVARAEPASAVSCPVASAGDIQEYAIPAGTGPGAITFGLDKRVWFVETWADKIAAADASGKVTEYALPAGSIPVGITFGLDGRVWFTESGSNRIVLPSPPRSGVRPDLDPCS